jgi:hypothetical protein
LLAARAISGTLIMSNAAQHANRAGDWVCIRFS